MVPTVLASETVCGLTFDQEAVAAYVASNVAADDLEFPGQLRNAVQFNQNTAGTMTASQTTALCAQISSLAETYGFTH